MGSVSNVSTNTQVKAQEKVNLRVPNVITAEERYGTFKELVAVLNERGSAGERENLGDGKYLTKYFSKDGNFIGGTYTHKGRDGKTYGTVTIGTLTYYTSDISGNGQMKGVFDYKKGTTARDINNDGIINPFEISYLGPPTITQ